MSFTITHVTPHITQIKPSGHITLEDSRALRAVLSELDGMLLVDFSEVPFSDCFKEFVRVRSLLPKTAVFGPEGTEVICQPLFGKDYYRSEVRHFTDKEDALIWLLSDESTQFAHRTSFVA